MIRNICVITGSRADFGLLKWLMLDIDQHPNLNLQIVITGSHLSQQFGSTEDEIKASGLAIKERVDILLSSDSHVSNCKSVGLGLISFADAFMRLNPDLILVLGDRFEIFSAASTAFMCQIPLVHLMGGELSEGAMDESIRHAITKMAHLHFVANETYRKRVIQLGEQPTRVHAVGGMGVDALHRETYLSKSEIERDLNIRFSEKNIIVTYHPVTLDTVPPDQQMNELLAALKQLKNTFVLFTFPNADAGNRKIIAAIEQYQRRNSNTFIAISLGQKKYLSILKHVDAVVGNSSSGLAEAPSFKIPTVNIGSRQNGRLKAASVIDCPAKRNDILKAIEKCYDPDFLKLIQNCTNPYGEPGASKKIIDFLCKVDTSTINSKTFFDIPFSVKSAEEINI